MNLSCFCRVADPGAPNHNPRIRLINAVELLDWILILLPRNLRLTLSAISCIKNDGLTALLTVWPMGYLGCHAVGGMNQKNAVMGRNHFLSIKSINTVLS